MNEKATSKDKQSSPGGRKARLADALRQNLRKRKASRGAPGESAQQGGQPQKAGEGNQT